MRVDIDKLEALEKAHHRAGWMEDAWCVQCRNQWPCETFELVREVRELRGIAEAARATVEEYGDASQITYDLLATIEDLAAALATLDASQRGEL